MSINNNVALLTGWSRVKVAICYESLTPENISFANFFLSTGMDVLKLHEELIRLRYI